MLVWVQQNILKIHICGTGVCGSVWDEKQLCAECVDVPKLSEHKYSDLWIRHNAQVSEAKVS